MKGDRVPVPNDLAARVLFASDRTCCVCRDPRRKTKIHHIDEDPSNNALKNLAVLCDDCHSEAHTRHAFARNLTAELIHEYNASWRAIVSSRLTPATEASAKREYELEALLDLSLVPHRWKNHYIALYPGHFEKMSADGGDVWDLLSQKAFHQYSEAEWGRYLPLFDLSLSEVARRIEQLLMLHHDVIPTALRADAIRLVRQLEVERSAYLMTPSLKDLTQDMDSFFTMRFKEVARRLGSFARAVDTARNAKEEER